MVNNGLLAEKATSPLQAFLGKKKPSSKLGFLLERERGFEPPTSTLARLHSTTELLPRRDPILAK